jgi:hypothetical protein
VEPSLSLERRKTTSVVEELSEPLSCFTLGVEPELNGEDSNDLSGIILLLLGSNLPLYIKIDRVDSGLGELSLSSICVEV